MVTAAAWKARDGSQGPWGSNPQFSASMFMVNGVCMDIRGFVTPPKRVQVPSFTPIFMDIYLIILVPMMV